MNEQELAKKILFSCGRTVLGKNSGGQIVKLLRQCGIEQAFHVLVTAAMKSDPREYLGAALRETVRPEIAVDEEKFAAQLAAYEAKRRREDWLK